MPAGHEIHQCDILKQDNKYLEHVCNEQGESCWRLAYALYGAPSEHDEIHMQSVLFCPGCGHDFRERPVSGQPKRKHEEKYCPDIDWAQNFG